MNLRRRFRQRKTLRSRRCCKAKKRTGGRKSHIFVSYSHRNIAVPSRNAKELFISSLGSKFCRKSRILGSWLLLEKSRGAAQLGTAASKVPGARCCSSCSPRRKRCAATSSTHSLEAFVVHKSHDSQQLEELMLFIYYFKLLF